MRGEGQGRDPDLRLLRPAARAHGLVQPLRRALRAAAQPGRAGSKAVSRGRLRFAVVEGRSGRSPRELRARLRHLSDRVHGERVLNLRREPIASSYRVFFRQIGIDPEEFRPPAEEAMLERLRAGRFASRNLLDDALTVALVETSVSVRAFDADKLTGRLGLRLALPRERLGGTGIELPDGAIVIADEERSVGLIFGETASGRGVEPRTEHIALCVVR